MGTNKERGRRGAGRYGRLAAALGGFLVGGLAGLLVSPSVLVSERKIEGTGDELVEILVAQRTVPAGTELGYAVVMRAQMPARFVSASMVRPEHVGQLVGEIALVTVLEGDPILWSHLAAGASESICRWVREANRSRTKE